MYRYVVGQPYIPGRTSYPEAIQYNYRGGHELLAWLQSPTAREVRDWRQGVAQFALYVEQPVIVLLHRFGDQPWSDSPFAWHRVPEDERHLPPTGQEMEMREPRALLQVTLVDADTGIVRVLRAVSWSPAFTAAVHLAIHDQAAAPWDSDAYDAALAAIYARYPATTDLLAAATSRTEGGR